MAKIEARTINLLELDAKPTRVKMVVEVNSERFRGVILHKIFRNLCRGMCILQEFSFFGIHCSTSIVDWERITASICAGSDCHLVRR